MNKKVLSVITLVCLALTAIINTINICTGFYWWRLVMVIVNYTGVVIWSLIVRQDFKEVTDKKA